MSLSTTADFLQACIPLKVGARWLGRARCRKSRVPRWAPLHSPASSRAASVLRQRSWVWRAGNCSAEADGISPARAGEKAGGTGRMWAASSQVGAEAQLEQRWCQTNDPSHLLSWLRQLPASAVWKKKGNHLQGWGMSIHFASSRFPFEGLRFVPQQSICTCLGTSWGTHALSLRPLEVEIRTRGFMWFSNAPNPQVHSVNTRKTQGCLSGLSNPSFL